MTDTRNNQLCREIFKHIRTTSNWLTWNQGSRWTTGLV